MALVVLLCVAASASAAWATADPPDPEEWCSVGGSRIVHTWFDDDGNMVGNGNGVFTINGSIIEPVRFSAEDEYDLMLSFLYWL
jgi:hypothetical protein